MHCIAAAIPLDYITYNSISLSTFFSSVQQKAFAFAISNGKMWSHLQHLSNGLFCAHYLRIDNNFRFIGRNKKTDRILTMHCYGISQVQVIEPIKSSLKFVEQMEKSK